MILTSESASGAAGSATCAPPAGSQAGDRLYFFATFDNIGGTVTLPSGVTPLIATGGGGGIDDWTGVLLLAGSPAADYTVSTTAGGDVSLTIVRANLEGGAFVSDTVVTRATGDSNTSTSGTATNAGDESTLLLFSAFDVPATVVTPPSGMDLLAYEGMASSAAVAYGETGFTTGTKSVVWSTSEEWGISGVVIRVVPAVAGPTITTQPAAQTVILSNGSEASFTVVSPDAESYQWQRDTGSGFANIDGATAATLALTGLTLADHGDQVRCRTANVNGTTDSNAATLSVYRGPQVETAFAASDAGGDSAGAVQTDFPNATAPRSFIRIVDASGVRTSRFGNTP